MRGLTDPRGDASSLRRTARRSRDAAIDGWSRAIACGSKGGCGAARVLEGDASGDRRGKVGRGLAKVALTCDGLVGFYGVVAAADEW
jgi:hypothetical protein